MASLASSTSSQYGHHLNDFKKFCSGRGITDYLNVQVTTGIEFLTELFKSGKSYSTINSARSGLSHYVRLTDYPDGDFGKHPLTAKFMRGVYKLRPPRARYQATWDVSLVLNRLRLVNNYSCTLKELSFKCVMLLALTTGQRVQTLTAMRLSLLVYSDKKIAAHFDSVLKTSKPGVHKVFEICKFEEDSSVCPVSCLNSYIEKTKNLRADLDQVFISFQKPHKLVTTQTLGRWITSVLKDCNINSSFTAHSTRSASASKAALSLDVNSVLKTVGWRNEQTFARFYNKPVLDSADAFSNSILH